METKPKEPLKQELIAQLELSKTETKRVQEAYKTALTREKELCLEIEQAKVDRNSALKVKEAAEEALKAAKESVERANRLSVEQLKKKDAEIDEFIELVAQTETNLDKAEKLNAAHQKEREKLTAQIVKLEKETASLQKRIGKNTIIPVSKPRPLFRVVSFCGGMAMILVLALAGSIYLEVAPTAREFIVSKISNQEDLLTGVAFNRTSDNVDIVSSYNMPLAAIREPISNWVSENGFDSVLFGTIRRWGGEEVLDTGANTVPLTLIVKEMRRRGSKKAISFAKNPDNIMLPSPFVKTSQGDIEFWQTRKKLASFIPTFWNDKKQVNFKSENFSGTIREGEAKIKTGDMPLEEMYPVDEPVESH